MRDLDLQTLRLFAAVCDQRSIARVAEQESIVGSAISKRLAQLEDTVGTPLLLRKRRGVVPTPAGETLLEHARTMLASVGQIERDMAPLQRNRAKLEEKLAGTTDHRDLAAVGADLASIVAKLETLEERWLEVGAAIEDRA